MAAQNSVRATALADNPLCTRLQTKFSGRGVAAAGKRSVSSNVRLTVENSRVASAANPFENTIELVPAGTKYANAENRASYANAEKRAGCAGTANRAGQAGKARARSAAVASMEKTQTFEKGTYAAAYARAASIRTAAKQYNQSHPGTAAGNTAAVVRAKPVGIRALFASDALPEKHVKSAPVSKGLIIAAIIITLTVMLMLFSFAQINEFKNEISGLERQRTELAETIEGLNVSIDGKNDIRMIENTAKNEIGMVKSNQVESHYVSVAAGERVEVVQETVDGENNSFGVFGTLMSAVGSQWDHIMEYIN